jgi:predicted Zn-dependent peptidase
MSNIREEKGYTYHIEAELDAYGDSNAFMISSETANDTVQPLIKEVYNEIDLLRNKPVSAEELELVRNYIHGELCREYEGVFPKSEVFINAWLSGEKFTVVNDYLDVVRSITAEEIQRLAQKYLVPQSMVEVIAGS